MISRCFPQPVPVRVAGCVLFAAQLRLRDLAALEAWAMTVTPCPTDGLGVDGPDFPPRLAAAYDEARAWPPEIGSATVDELLSRTPEGRAMIVTLACRPWMTHELAAEVVGAMSDEDWHALRSVAMADDPSPFAWISAVVDQLAGVEPFEPRREGGTPSTWERVIIAACDGDPTRLEAIGDLTVGQWILFQTDGEPFARLDPLPENAAVEERVQLARSAWWNQRTESNP
jgi:hypothetical protein